MKRKAHYRAIPAWFDESTGELEGRNWFYEILIEINVWLDVNVFDVEDFPIWVEVDDDDPNFKNEGISKRNDSGAG